MKNVILTISLFLSSVMAFSSPQEVKDVQSDTLCTSITIAQANDTILAYVNDPWFVILDVRTPGEYVGKHLVEGVNIDFNSPTFSATLATLNKSKVYLIHCASGGRSGQTLTIMQNMHFRKVYNMLGGMNAWSAALYPTTTTSAPVAGILSDSLVIFNEIAVNTTDSIKLTVTNAANDLLSFTSVSDLSGTPFSTSFNVDTTLQGARDYSFYVNYQPTDVLPDSTVFSIQTNGGIIDFYLYGKVSQSTFMQNKPLSFFSICNDVLLKQIKISLHEYQKNTSLILYDSGGRVVYESTATIDNFIDYSNLQRGIYFLNVRNSKMNHTVKLPLVSQ